MSYPARGLATTCRNFRRVAVRQE